MKTTATFALISAMLLTSVAAYAKPEGNNRNPSQNSGQWGNRNNASEQRAQGNRQDNNRTEQRHVGYGQENRNIERNDERNGARNNNGR